MMLPNFIKTYLWDTPIEHVHPQRHVRFIAERLMEHGDRKASRWLLRTYTRPTLQRVVRESRRLSRRSRHYWALVLNDRTHRTLCTKSQSHRRRRHAWPR
ncbi:hypothetical protein HY635_03690 [Candidatus Uhrbacteria bacterium]|nr:hypothetical protein [Candidatus Uhrbacteria bacterium]